MLLAERILGATEILMEVVDDFKRRAEIMSLPGFKSDSSTTSSMLQTLDEKFIKFLLNKRLDNTEKKFVFLKIYLAVHGDSPKDMTSYKTVGFEGSKTIEQVIQVAKRKFKVSEEFYDLFTLVEGIGTLFILTCYSFHSTFYTLI